MLRAQLELSQICDIMVFQTQLLSIKAQSSLSNSSYHFVTSSTLNGDFPPLFILKQMAKPSNKTTSLRLLSKFSSLNCILSLDKKSNQARKQYNKVLLQAFMNYEQMQINIVYNSLKFGYSAHIFDLHGTSAKEVLENSYKKRERRYQVIKKYLRTSNQLHLFRTQLRLLSIYLKKTLKSIFCSLLQIQDSK